LDYIFGLMIGLLEQLFVSKSPVLGVVNGSEYWNDGTWKNGNVMAARHVSLCA
jgi:hypothetical protein